MRFNKTLSSKSKLSLEPPAVKDEKSRYSKKDADKPPTTLSSQHLFVETRRHGARKLLRRLAMNVE